MKNVLFVNACVREHSRTRALAQTVLECLGGTVTEVNLNRCNALPMGREALAQREKALEQGQLDSPAFQLARQFAQAEEIVIAAPFWDLMFPAMLKVYLESVCISGITFRYQEGIPQGLCKARRLIYVTTAGGYIPTDYGFQYIDALCKTFFAIPETRAFRCQGLDIWGNDPQKLLADAQKEAQQALGRQCRRTVTH